MPCIAPQNIGEACPIAEAQTCEFTSGTNLIQPFRQCFKMGFGHISTLKISENISTTEFIKNIL